MNDEQQARILTRVEQKIDSLHNRYNEAEQKVDTVLGWVADSRWTACIAAGLALSCLALGWCARGAL